jgi:excisionase family DNA binding protein
MDDWLETEPAMRFLGCKRSKFYQLVNSGKVRVTKIGRPHRYFKQDLEKVKNSRIERCGA